MESVTTTSAVLTPFVPVPLGRNFGSAPHTGFLTDAANLPLLPFLRPRLRFAASPFDGNRPSVDSIVVPVN